MKKVVFESTKVLLGLIFCGVFVLLLLFTQCNYACRQSFLLPNFALFLIILLLFAGFFALNRLYQTKMPQLKSNVISVDKIVYFSCLLLFFLQVYAAFNLYFETDWDPKAIMLYARTLMIEECISPTYFSKYPNNLLFFFFEFYVFKFNSQFGIFSGSQQVLSIILINYLLNALTCLLVYKTASLLTKKRYAFCAYLLAFLNLGLSPWSLICYTDALGLIFPILTLYVFIRPVKHKWLSYALSAIIGTIGYFLKPQCFILLIAVLIIELIYAFKDKSQIKPLLLSFLCIVVTFVAMKGGINALCARKNIVLNQEQSYSAAHFFMMGLNEETKGVFSADDMHYSGTFATKAERTEANLQTAASRIQNMGSLGLMKQLARKALCLYNDGTYAWQMEGSFLDNVPEPPNTVTAPFLRSIYYPDGSRYLYFTTFEQFIWLMILLLGAAGLFSSFSHKHAKTLNILWLTWIGLTVFELLFEVRARYLYTNVPLFCVLAAVGIENIRRLFCRITENLSARLPAKKSV